MLLLLVSLLFLVCGSAAAADLEVVHPPWLTPGGQAVVAVSVSQDSQALALRSVEIATRDGALLGVGRTGLDGRAWVSVSVPASQPTGMVPLVVQAAGERVELSLLLRSEASLRLSLEPARVETGATVTLDAEVLERVRRVPIAQQPLRLWLEDPDGRVVSEAQVVADDEGRALAVLDTPAGLEGQFVAGVQAGDAHLTTPLSVVAPMGLELSLEPAVSWVTPGDALPLLITARGPDGSAAAGARVELVAATVGTHDLALASERYPEGSAWPEDCAYKLARGVGINHYARLELQLDEAGQGWVSVPPPSYGLDELQHDGFLALRAEVLDATGSRGVTDGVVPFAPEPLLVGFDWQHGPLAGVPSRAVITVQHPDGSPAHAALSLQLDAGAPVEASTSRYGIAAVDVLMDELGPLTLSAQGEQGQGVQVELGERSGFFGVWGTLDPSPGLILDRAVLRSGDALSFELRSAVSEEPVMVSVVLAGSLIAQRQLTLSEPVQRLTFGLPAHLRGILSIQASRGGSDERVQALVIPQGEDLDMLVRQQLSAGALASTPGLPMPADGLDDPAYQQAMGHWLSLQEGEALWPRTMLHRAASPTPPEWLAGVVKRLESACPPFGARASEFALRAGGPLLALLLLGVWLARWRRLPMGLQDLTVVALVVGLAVAAALPWARGPMVAPPDDDGGPMPVEWEHLRHYPGLDAADLDPGAVPNVDEAYPPTTNVLLVVASSGLWLDGVQVAGLEDGMLPESLSRGQLITPLYDRALERAEVLKSLGEQGRASFRGTLTLVVEPEVPFSIVRMAMYTMGQAQFSEYHQLTPDELRCVVPEGPGPSRHPWAFGALLAGLAVTLVACRSRPWIFVVYGLTLCFAGLLTLAKRYPLAEISGAGLHLPMQSALLALFPVLLAFAAVALLWQGLRGTRRQLAPVGTLGLCVVLLGLPLTRDHRGWVWMPSSGLHEGGRLRVHELSPSQRLPVTSAFAAPWPTLNPTLASRVVVDEAAVDVGPGDWLPMPHHPVLLSRTPTSTRWLDKPAAWSRSAMGRGSARMTMDLFASPGAYGNSRSSDASYDSLLDDRGVPSLGELDAALQRWSERSESKAREKLEWERERDQWTRDLFGPSGSMGELFATPTVDEEN